MESWNNRPYNNNIRHSDEISAHNEVQEGRKQFNDRNGITFSFQTIGEVGAFC